MTWRWWLILALALAAPGLSLHSRTSIGAPRGRLVHANAAATGIPPQRNAETGERTVAVVVNPTKIRDMRDPRAVVEQATADTRYSATRWYDITPDDPGAGQARAALTEGPTVVITVGGDGTVRTVTGQLTGTDTPLNILSLETGNLLARNLNLPLGSSLSNLVMAALTGRPQRINVSRIGAPEPTEGELAQIADMGPDARSFAGREPFLVITGMGFDADVMNDADHGLKHAIGWGAYLVSGFKFMRRSRVNATVMAGDGSNSFRVEARSILFADCMQLPTSFVLAPDARIDDGWLDLVLMDTKGWIFGWSGVIRRVGLHGIGVRRTILPSADAIDLRRIRSVTVTANRPELVEADNDALGYVMRVTAEIDPLALTVHVL